MKIKFIRESGKVLRGSGTWLFQMGIGRGLVHNGFYADGKARATQYANDLKCKEVKVRALH